MVRNMCFYILLFFSKKSNQVKSFILDQVGLILQNEVAASMKGDTLYGSQVAVTRDSIAATSCTCKAGSHGLERGVCVHNLPLILQLVLLLVDGLANHILVEICHRWNTHLESKIDKLGQLDMAKKAILILMKANGTENTSTMLHLSVNEILKKVKNSHFICYAVIG